MDVKGQVSVEYLLVILVIIIILGSVSIPLIRTSINSSMDISKTSDASTAVNSIANAVNVVYANGPGAKRTVSVYIPVSSSLDYNGNSITMNVAGVAKNSSIPINESNSSTMEGVNASVPCNVQFNSTSSSTASSTIPVNKGQWYTVTVQWVVGDNCVTVTVG
jgi:uncharacterized protein (UPF0333 family)